MDDPVFYLDTSVLLAYFNQEKYRKNYDQLEVFLRRVKNKELKAFTGAHTVAEILFSKDPSAYRFWGIIPIDFYPFTVKHGDIVRELRSNVSNENLKILDAMHLAVAYRIAEKRLGDVYFFTYDERLIETCMGDPSVRNRFEQVGMRLSIPFVEGYQKDLFGGS